MTEPVLAKEDPPRILNLRRSLILNTASSALTPIVGLVTAPVLARALGVEGRGEFSASLAPALGVGSVAAFGLSEALTYRVAKSPAVAIPALWRALVFVTLMGIPAITAVWLLAPYLSGGNPDLARLMRIATVFCFPVLHLSLLRGVAAGRQMWGTITAERITSAVLRLVLIVGLALGGHLTVLSAVLLSSLLPVATATIYWRVLQPAGPSAGHQGVVFRELLSFGARTWVGSVAVMLLSRLNQLLLTPLSSVEQVGLLAIAITVADVPYIFTVSVRDVLFGVSSATADIHQLARVSRLTLVLTGSGSGLIAATLPFWLAPLFGNGFEAAIPLTLLLLISGAISVPGMMMGAAAAALGRPGVRSTAQAVALVVNISGVVLLAPHLGALGAGLASVIDASAVLTLTAWRLRALTDVRTAAFILPRVQDVTFLAQQLVNLVVRRRAAR